MKKNKQNNTVWECKYHWYQESQVHLNGMTKRKTWNDYEENKLSLGGPDCGWYTGVLYNRLEVELVGHSHFCHWQNEIIGNSCISLDHVRDKISFWYADLLFW